MLRLIGTVGLCLAFCSAYGWAQEKKKRPAGAEDPSKSTSKSTSTSKSKSKSKSKGKGKGKAAPGPAGAGAAKSAQAAKGQSQFVEVLDLQMASGVKDRKPEGASETFEAGSRAVTWIKLKVKEPETVVKLRYSRNGRPVWTSNPLTVRKSPRFRTWIKKRLPKAGQWKVEVLDAEDTPVDSLGFTVK